MVLVTVGSSPRLLAQWTAHAQELFAEWRRVSGVGLIPWECVWEAGDFFLVDCFVLASGPLHMCSFSLECPYPLSLPSHLLQEVFLILQIEVTLPALNSHSIFALLLVLALCGPILSFQLDSGLPEGQVLCSST